MACGDWDPGTTTRHTECLYPDAGRFTLYIRLSILPLLDLHPELSEGIRMRQLMQLVFV